MDIEQIGTDFIQRYKNTFVRVRWGDDSPYQVMFVEEVNKDPLSVTLENVRLGRIILNYETRGEFNFEYPQTGYYNFRGIATIFQRRHLRQWKRGICDATCSMDTPYSQILRIRWNSQPTTAKLFAAFRPRPDVTSLSKATRMLDGGCYLSVPLTSKMALGLSPSGKTKAYFLWYLEALVGRVVVRKNKSSITLAESQFKQEVADLLYKTGEVNRYVVT